MTGTEKQCIRLKSFRINKTLKLTDVSGNVGGRLKSFRINKTLKLEKRKLYEQYGLKSFRINKTLKPQIQFSPSRYLLAIEGC